MSRAVSPFAKSNGHRDALAISSRSAQSARPLNSALHTPDQTYQAGSNAGTASRKALSQDLLERSASTVTPDAESDAASTSAMREHSPLAQDADSRHEARPQAQAAAAEAVIGTDADTVNSNALHPLGDGPGRSSEQ